MIRNQEMQHNLTKLLKETKNLFTVPWLFLNKKRLLICPKLSHRNYHNILWLLLGTFRKFKGIVTGIFQETVVDTNSIKSIKIRLLILNARA